MTPGQAVQRDQMWGLVERGELNAAIRLAARLMGSVTDPDDLAEVHAAVGLMTQRVGRLAESRDHFDLAAQLTAADPRVRSGYLADAAGSRFLLGDLAGAASAAQQAHSLGERHGNRFAACEALNSLAAVALGHGRPREALRLTKQSIALQASETESRGGGPMSHLYHGMTLVDLDRFADADAAFSEGLRRATGARAVGQVTWYHAMRGLGRYLNGRWDEALADARAAIDAAAGSGTGIALPYAHAVTGMVEGHRGNLAAARRLIPGREGELTALGPPGSDWLCLARAATTADPSEVYAVLVDAWLHTRRAPYFSSWRSLSPHLVHHALLRRDRETADEVADASRSGAVLAEDVASARATALFCAALTQGDADAALACLEDYRRADRPFSLALACLRTARVFAAAGDPRTARAVTREAAEIFDGLRAMPWVARAGTAFRRLAPPAAGPDVGSPAPAAWDVLTPTEREVARLVAEGRTNPEVGKLLGISPRTVQTHVAHIYAKLAISSRAQLAGLMYSDHR